MELATTIYRPENPIAAMFVVHGMQEHRRRYEAFAEYMKNRNIAVVTYDLPGHGETAGGKDYGYFGETEGWKTLVDSAVQTALLTRKEFPCIPLICFGHSMGTIIGRCFLQNNDQLIDAMIFNGSPPYFPAAPGGKILARSIMRFKGKKGHSAILDRLTTGDFIKSVENPRTAVDWLSHNRESIDEYINDPECGIPFTCRGYYDLYDGIVRMNDISLYRCTKPDLPILMMAGEDDPCTGGKERLKGSADTLRKAGYTEVEIKLYPGMRHETLNEINSVRVMADTAAWIEGVIPSFY